MELKSKKSRIKYLLLPDNGKFASVNTFTENSFSDKDIAVLRSYYLDIDFCKTDRYREMFYGFSLSMIQLVSPVAMDKKVHDKYEMEKWTYIIQKEKYELTNFSRLITNNKNDFFKTININSKFLTKLFRESRVYNDSFVNSVIETCTNNNIPAPTRINNSGNGFHLYWDIKDSSNNIGLDGQTMSKYYKHVQSKLYEMFKHYGADKNALNVGRLLRVEGSINNKKGLNIVCRKVFQGEFISGLDMSHILDYTLDEVKTYKEATSEQKRLIASLQSEKILFMDESLSQRQNKYLSGESDYLTKEDISVMVDFSKNNKKASSKQVDVIKKIIKTNNKIHLACAPRNLSIKEADSLIKKYGRKHYNGENHLYNKLKQIKEGGYIKEGNRAYFSYYIGMSARLGTNIMAEAREYVISNIGEEYIANFESGTNSSHAVSHDTMTECFSLPEGYFCSKEKVSVSKSRVQTKRRVSESEIKLARQMVRKMMMMGCYSKAEIMNKTNISLSTYKNLRREVRNNLKAKLEKSKSLSQFILYVKKGVILSYKKFLSSVEDDSDLWNRIIQKEIDMWDYVWTKEDYLCLERMCQGVYVEWKMNNSIDELFEN